METIFVDRTFTGSGIATYSDNMMETIIVPKISSFSNVTYIGKKAVANNSEYFFQVNGSDDVYLMIRCTGTFTNQSRSIGLFLTNTADTTGSTATNYLNGGNNTFILQPASRLTWSMNYSHISFYMYLISDTNNNLQVIFTPNPSYSVRTYSNPIVFSASAKGKFVATQFATGSNSLINYYMDDSTSYYYTPQSVTAYDSLTDVLKVNDIPLTLQSNTSNVVDSITNGKFVRIYNSNLDAQYVSNSNDNNSGMIRKLIRVGSTYYRQLVTNFWHEDPKGDEEPEIYDDTQPSS